MKRSFLVTGASGSGKTTLCTTLERLGFEAYDIEAEPGLFTLVDVRTGKEKPLSSHDNLDLDQVANAQWLCNTEKLAAFVARQRTELAFYCGLGTNIADAFPLFAKVFMLEAGSERIRKRLAERATSDFGSAPEVREWILERDAKLQEQFQERGAIPVSSEGTPEETARNITRLAASAPR